ncbi:MAG: hypothetical protein WBA97_09010 [Actinophytocola sp.]
MLFSHPEGQHERSGAPTQPVPHENLFREPETDVKIRTRRAAMRHTNG